MDTQATAVATPSVTPVSIPSLIPFFPVQTPPRDKQLKFLDFIQRAVERGYRDIVIEAPTGVGKSYGGAAACFWASSTAVPAAQAGGYYLVTQKLLQDQLERDFVHFQSGFDSAAILKSATEYACPTHMTCALGRCKNSEGGDKPASKCRLVREKMCLYQLAKEAFMRAQMSVTNYPYFFTERSYVGQLIQRQVLVCDEAHNLESQILRHVDITVDEGQVKKWTSALGSVPKLETMEKFLRWLDNEYLPVLEASLETYKSLAEDQQSKEAANEVAKIERQIGKVKGNRQLVTDHEDEWVYWQETDRKGNLQSTLRPLFAAPFMGIVTDAAAIRIYMSAYPGEKSVFCRSLGLVDEQVAWIRLGSPFPAKNRPIIMSMVGSMSKKNVDETLPAFLRLLEKIFTKHTAEKGLIHVVSYKLGEAIFNHFAPTDHGHRLIFPKNSEERESAFEQHKRSDLPTIIISPSMTEGFDFSDDLSRWQVIAKVPFPSLGDAHVLKKKEVDPEWYTMQAVSSIIQATGRNCRHETDTGISYICDRDFMLLWERAGRTMFPKWWTDAMVWTPKKATPQT